MAGEVSELSVGSGVSGVSSVSWTDEVEEYLAALGRGDRRAALGQVRRLLGQGQDVMTLIHGLLAPAQLRVGDLWVSDAWSVAQEHAATAISEAVLTTLASDGAAHQPPAPGAPTLVVTCVEQEWHALPALMVSEHLRAEGFTVSYLGANSSSQGLVRHVHELGPRAVLLSCSLSTFLPLLRRQLEAVRETGTPVVVGGSAFDAGGRRARVLGATAFATHASGVAEIVRSLPAAVPPVPPLTHPGAEEAYVVFGDREDLAEEVTRQVLRTWGGEVSWLRVLEDQLPHLVGSVGGALISDDDSLVEQALGWAEGILIARGAPQGCGSVLREALRSALHELPAASQLIETL